MTQRLKAAAPYLLGLAGAVVLFVLAGNFHYAARPGQLGPDFWPRVALVIIAVACVYELGRMMLMGSTDADVQGIAERLDREELDATSAEADANSRLPLLLGGMALTLAYAVLVPVLGFLLASYLFLVIFMYLGGERRHIAIWVTSTLGILAFAFVFLKLVYVSIPRGEPPFDQVTQLVMDLLQIR